IDAGLPPRADQFEAGGALRREVATHSETAAAVRHHARGPVSPAAQLRQRATRLIDDRQVARRLAFRYPQGDGLPGPLRLARPGSRPGILLGKRDERRDDEEPDEARRHPHEQAADSRRDLAGPDHRHLSTHRPDPKALVALAVVYRVSRLLVRN